MTLYLTGYMMHRSKNRDPSCLHTTTEVVIITIITTYLSNDGRDTGSGLSTVKTRLLLVSLHHETLPTRVSRVTSVLGTEVPKFPTKPIFSKCVLLYRCVLPFIQGPLTVPLPSGIFLTPTTLLYPLSPPYLLHSRP